MQDKGWDPRSHQFAEDIEVCLGLLGQKCGVVRQGDVFSLQRCGACYEYLPLRLKTISFLSFSCQVSVLGGIAAALHIPGPFLKVQHPETCFEFIVSKFLY